MVGVLFGDIGPRSRVLCVSFAIESECPNGSSPMFSAQCFRSVVVTSYVNFGLISVPFTGCAFDCIRISLPRIDLLFSGPNRALVRLFNLHVGFFMWLRGLLVFLGIFES